MKLTLAFSPCPNDTFIFDALIHHKIDTQGLEFTVALEDVETLNQKSIAGEFDISKVSYGVISKISSQYKILNSGSALGSGVGPLLITTADDNGMSIENKIVAIPGENTTAHLLFSFAYPDFKKKVFMRYDEIEDFVIQKKGLGVIIHENRFTYEEKGLKKIMDLGAYWEQHQQMPIPLGGIVIRRNLDLSLQQKVDRLIKQSIEYAFQHSQELNDYIKDNAQEMSEDVMRKHIELYVNDYSIALGISGRQAIRHLLKVSAAQLAEEIDRGELFVTVESD